MKKINAILAMTAASFMLFSCGGDKKNDTTTAPETQTEVETTTSEVTEGVQIELSGNDAMQFDKKEIKVPVGEKVTLILKHTGKMDKAVMGHNFVLLNKGTDMAAFAEAAAKAKDNDYIPTDDSTSVLAHTKTIGGGETTTVEFVVNEAGEYDFLCSFPAHYALMQGKLIAE